MPNSSSFWVMRILSSTEKETDSPCVPSRRVVSNVAIFILRYFLRYAGFLFLLEEGHHLTQLAAHLFDGLSARCFAHREEIVAAAFVFGDPLAGKLSGL